MIVSSYASPGTGHVVLQSDHAALASQLAEAFGNHDFEAPEPRDLMQFLALHHDRGWDETDAHIGRNPATGLPFSLVNTPLPELLLSGPRSVDFNSRHHPYCGLLASMHVWGLFNGRYGLSDKIVVNMLAGEAKIKVDAMLQTIVARRDQLTYLIAEVPAQCHLLESSKLMQNYKLLQFFDTLSLYFNENAGRTGAYPSSDFLHVPQSSSQDCVVSLQPLGDQVFRVAPFPFAGTELVLTHKVYDIPVHTVEVDYQKVFAAANWTNETITLVA